MEKKIDQAKMDLVNLVDLDNLVEVVKRVKIIEEESRVETRNATIDNMKKKAFRRKKMCPDCFDELIEVGEEIKKKEVIDLWK